MKNGKFLTLGIESSCDETAASVTANGREVLSNVIASQIDIHKVFGGVVPEIASRHHLTQINLVIEEALEEADVSFEDIDLIGVTEGPGLIGAVLIGLATAKALSFSTGKPLTGVHHIKGHIFASFLENENLEPPFISLVVSGGHTEIVDVKAYNELEVLGKTRDDAVGEAFDKVARVLGLGYPGGPKVDALAKEGDPSRIPFKKVFLDKDTYDFSFSGTKTGVMNYMNTEKQAGREVNIADVAAGFQESVIDVIIKKTIDAVMHSGYGKLCVGGGVACNSLLRKRLISACEESEIELYIPSPIFCTDNAAMVACTAYYDYRAGKIDSLELDAKSNLIIR